MAGSRISWPDPPSPVRPPACAASFTSLPTFPRPPLRPLLPAPTCGACVARRHAGVASSASLVSPALLIVPVCLPCRAAPCRGAGFRAGQGACVGVAARRHLHRRHLRRTVRQHRAVRPKEWGELLDFDFVSLSARAPHGGVTHRACRRAQTKSNWPPLTRRVVERDLAGTRRSRR